MTAKSGHQDSSDAKQRAWEESYSRNENHVFWPSDEMVRFVSRFLRRRVGIDEVIDVLPGARGARVLDVGCGIGRNLVFGLSMGLDMSGIELSQAAVETARRWVGSASGREKAAQITQGDVRSLPWPDAYFDHAISDSALDSMHYSIAKAGVREVARVLKAQGFFYCNLIAGEEAPGSAKEHVVHTQHERDTIQSYFDRAKIEDLFGSCFEFVQLNLIQEQDRLKGASHGRWHLVLKRTAGRP